MTKEQKSEQYLIAHPELIDTTGINVDEIFKRIDDPDALAEFERVRLESEARIAQVDAETLAFIQAENAKVFPEHEKSEQWRIAHLDELPRSIPGGER